MPNSTFTFDWKSHIVLACITCQNVILFTKPDGSAEEARKTLEEIRTMLKVDLDQRNMDDAIVNLFLPTICSSCDELSSWTSMSISKEILEIWEPFLAVKAFLEGWLSMIGSPIRLVHRDKIVKFMGSRYIGRSVTVNTSQGPALDLQPHLRTGFL
jgi:hypothetical protein